MNVEKFVNNFYLSNTYILSSAVDEGVWIVDVGDVSNIVRWLRDNHKKIEGVLLTHTHFDHIYGLNDLLEYDPGLKVYTSEEGKIALSSDKLNLSRYHEKSFVFRGEDIVALEESIMRLWKDVDCRVYKTPGHDWSCLTYEIEDYLFAGDAYIPGEKLVTSFPKSNRNDALKSLAKIRQISKIGYKICPGHGDILTVI